MKISTAGRFVTLALASVAVQAMALAGAALPSGAPSVLYATVASADDRADAKRLNARLLKADSRDREDILDEASPRYWNDLTRTGRSEALEAFEALGDSEDSSARDADRGLFAIERALRFAAVNDAIYDRAGAGDIAGLLSPDLTRHLGNSGGSDLEEGLVGESILKAAGDDTFADIASFERAYWEAVQANWSGK